MVFQAFRLKYPTDIPCTSRFMAFFVNRIKNFRVPCAPVRSSYAAAYEDVKKYVALGYVAAVRVVEPMVTI